ncbi:hypothetical protein PBI_ARROYO_64 [Microbacterium phage Arroyo]|uniref:hypothetical protein n=1 Tax=Microbacterium phage Arroyo TaxID=2591213 RepID=UPI001163C7FB|nr:hypothetical protein QDW24_gp64 [Microbacterium phage Arroyo]QDH93480.1 hypothetical protein PBI_ARROYO_64 [Microbacterium phage Arroyo]
MSTTLKLGDELRLTGPDWQADHGRGPNLIVTVDRFEGLQAWSNIDGVGSLTNHDGTPLDGGYELEVIEKPAQPTTQGYTLSLYVSKTAAAEFPGETQELASITIAHDDLELLLRKGRGILEVVQDG